jgi:hypothetical protein
VTFKEWINERYGERGVAAAARFLGYPYKTVISWVNFERFPRPKTQEIIKLKSDDKIDMDGWRTAYLKADLSRKKP